MRAEVADGFLHETGDLIGLGGRGEQRPRVWRLEATHGEFGG